MDSSNDFQIEAVSTMNFEDGKSPYRVTLTASDGSLDSAATMVITVKNVNDQPELSDKDCSISKAAPIDTLACAVEAVDDDYAPGLTYVFGRAQNMRTTLCLC